MYKQAEKILEAYKTSLKEKHNVIDLRPYLSVKTLLKILMKAGITEITNDVVWNFICKNAYQVSRNTTDEYYADQQDYQLINPADAFYKIIYNQRNQEWFDKQGKKHISQGMNYKITLEIDNISKYHFGLHVKNDIINYIFNKKAYVTLVTPHATYYVGAIEDSGTLKSYQSRKRWEEDTGFWEKYKYEETQFNNDYRYFRNFDSQHYYAQHPTRVTKTGEKSFYKEFPLHFYEKIEILKNRASRYGIDISFISDDIFSGVNSTLYRNTKEEYSDVYLQRSYQEKWLTRPEFSTIDITRIEDCYQSLKFFENLCNEGHDLVAEGFLSSEDFATCPCCGHPVRLVKEVKNLTHEEFQQCITLIDTECDRCNTIIEAVR